MIRERTLETEDHPATEVDPGVEATTTPTIVEMDEFLNVEDVEDNNLEVIETTRIIETEEEQTTDSVGNIEIDEEQTTISSITSSTDNPLSDSEGEP